MFWPLKKRASGGVLAISPSASLQVADPSAQAVPNSPARKRSTVHRIRAYAAAVANRLTSDWNAPDTTADMEIEVALPILRQRARDLERNNDYIRRFFNLLLANVVGHTGIGLEAKTLNPDGSMDEYANRLIEEAWQEWGEVGSCTVCGRYSFLDVLMLCLRSVARDGEVLVYMPPSWRGNDAGFALQLIEADHLDIRYNADLANGNIIRMGVEMDPWRRAIAYHILTRHPADHGGYTKGSDRVRVLAEYIIHFRKPERVDETRSAPWITCSAARIRQITAAEEAEVVAWRIAASKMGFYIPGDDPNYDGDDEADDGNPIQEAEPGVFELLKSGWDFKEWNPDKPSSTVESFLKAELRGVASGLNVSYTSLSNNLEGVSFSSIRSGEISDRDNWRVLQTLIIQHLCHPIYKQWLKTVLTTGYLALSPSRYRKYLRVTWRPRGWEWVDPQAESTAAENDVRLGVASLFDVAAKHGRDLEEVFAANEQAIKLAKKYNLELEVFKPKTNAAGATKPAPAKE